METSNGETRTGLAVLEERLSGCQAQSRAAGERLSHWQATAESRLERMEKALTNMRTASLDRTSKIFVGVLVLLGPVLVVLLQYLLH